MVKILAIIICLAPMLGFSQQTLEINIYNLEDDKGDLRLGIFAVGDEFGGDNPYKGVVQKISGSGNQLVKVMDLPVGKYAVAVLKDNNGNGQMDKNWMGIPEEQYGFTNIEGMVLSLPSFEECSFDLLQDQTTAVKIKLR